MGFTFKFTIFIFIILSFIFKFTIFTFNFTIYHLHYNNVYYQNIDVCIHIIFIYFQIHDCCYNMPNRIRNRFRGWQNLKPRKIREYTNNTNTIYNYLTICIVEYCKVKYISSVFLKYNMTLLWIFKIHFESALSESSRILDRNVVNNINKLYKKFATYYHLQIRQ